MSEIEVSTLRAALLVRREEMTNALQPDFDAAFDVTLSPEEAHASSSPLVSGETDGCIEMQTIESGKQSEPSSPVNNEALRRRTRSGDESGVGKGGRSQELQALYDEASIQFPQWVCQQNCRSLISCLFCEFKSLSQTIYKLI